MKRCVMIILAIMALLHAAGCGGSANQGGGSLLEAVIIAPDEMKGGKEAVWRVNINGFNGPFHIHWDFGGGAVVNEHDFTNELSPNLLKVEMINPGSEEKRYKATVTVSDKVGAVASTQYSYGVGSPANRPPLITNAVYNSGLVLVAVSDPDGDPVSVHVVDEFGNDLGTQTDTVTQFDVNRWYGFWLDREVVVTITADDGKGGVVSTERSYLPEQVELGYDRLYAIATKSHASVVEDPLTSGPGSGVLVVVASGVPDWPFQFMNGVGLTCEDGSDYVRGTFDAGAPDGTPDIGEVTGIDGIWALTGASDLEIPADDEIGGTHRAEAEPGLGRLDFFIRPVGGTDLTDAQGVLFSFELGFTQAGEYHLGFQKTEGVSRTWYQNSGDPNELFWGDISNTGVPSTIIVE